MSCGSKPKVLNWLQFIVDVTFSLGYVANDIVVFPLSGALVDDCLYITQRLPYEILYST